MTDYHDGKGYRLQDLHWCISWRFLVSAPWGATQQELTVDAPPLVDKLEESRKLGLMLWANALAPASSRSLHLDAVQTMCWHGMLMPTYDPYANVHGTQFGPSTDRSTAGVLKFLTGDNDGSGSRRVFIPAMPSGWAADDLLTRDGAEQLQALARGLYIGATEAGGASSMVLLNAYPRMFEGDGLMVHPVGFRKVTHIRVCQYTERAPSPGAATWPG
jgi:hypothetical protein